MKELIVSYRKNVLIVEIGPSKLKLWVFEHENCIQLAISHNFNFEAPFFL